MWNCFIFFSFVALFLQAKSYETHDNKTEHLYSRNEENIKVLATEFKKSDNDPSSYRLIEMPNKLQVLLISDPQVELSGASMSVGIGHYCDPDDIPGLAHFCEHMLFMGTKKYPKEDEFSSYVERNYGQYNAYTASEETNYFFYITSDNYEQALDRFSQFFIAPLFSKNGVEREVHAVDSEFKIKKVNDAWRMNQIEKTHSNKKSPYSRFEVGNYQTLMENPRKNGKDILKEVRDFYSKYYSANLMKLVMASKEPLDELQKLAIKYFSQILNKNIQKPEFKEEPLTSENLGVQYWYKTDHDVIQAILTFPVKSLETLYKTNPASYLEYLLQHQSSGSLYEFLFDKNWILTIDTAVENIVSNTDFFRIYLTLTPKGLDEYENVIQTIFQYLNMLRKKGPQKWIFDELLYLDEMLFRFSDYVEPHRRMAGLSTIMHKTGLDYSDLLRFYFVSEYNSEHITHLLDSLRPNNYMLFISSSTKPGNWDRKEDIYESEYKLEPLPETLQKIDDLVLNDLFTLPTPNKYISRKFIINPPSKNRTNKPYLEYNTPIIRYWYKEDDTHSSPRTHLSLFFKIPGCSDTPLQKVELNVYTVMLLNSISEIEYYARVAGHDISIVPHKLGFQLFIFGYTDKILELLKDVLDVISKFEPTLSKYNVSAEYLKQSLYASSYDVANHMYTDAYWSYNEVVSVLDSLTFSDVEMFHKVRFSQLFVEVLGVGVLPNNTPIFIENYVKNISKSVLDPFRHFDSRSSILEKGSNYIYQLYTGKHNTENSYIYYSLQIGDITDPQLVTLIDILHLVVMDTLFNQLRTKEQLGYSVRSNYFRVSNIIGYYISLTTSRDPFYVEQRIIAYLYKLEAIIEAITDEEFKKYVSSITTAYSIQPKSIYVESNKYWNSIYTGLYDFDYDIMALDVLKKLTKKDLKDFFYKYIHPDSPNRKKLSIHLSSRTLGKVYSNDLSLERLYYYFKCKKLKLPFQDFVALIESNPELHDLEKSIRKLLKKKYPNATNISKIVTQAFKYLENQYTNLKRKAMEDYNAVNFSNPIIFKNSLGLSSVPLPPLPWEKYMRP